MNDDESMTKGYLYQCVEADYLLKKEKEDEKEVLELFDFDFACINVVKLLN